MLAADPALMGQKKKKDEDRCNRDRRFSARTRVLFPAAQGLRETQDVNPQSCSEFIVNESRE
jgi:hypothetical protein